MLNYLLQPNFQFVDINGKPLVGGWIEVFLHNTTTPYITKADFDGTDNPFKVPLNSKGMAVIIASGDFTYDVFCYDRFGSLFWSGSDVAIDGAGGIVIDGAELPMRIVGGKITNNGKDLTCTGENAWAEGGETTASGANAHAEGGQTTASGEHSHSEGFRTTASSGYSHAEGAGSKASNTASHAEGQDTTASGQASHAEGRGSVASGDYSHASGRGTRATGEGSTAVGKWNDDGDALFVVGGGTASNNRKDVFKVDLNGDTWVLVNNALVRVNNCSQFVLTRSNMTTAFTNDEYSDCVNSVTNGIAVCVQLGTSLQLQLTQISSLGIHFEATFGDYHYTYVVAPTANAHTISENIRHFGTPIYGTLQDAISDADALLVGMYFETNGFHTSGDGGAARYRVSSTGTANGMDIVQLAAGKLAVLQIQDFAYPDQLGYVRNDGTQDVVPYINQIFSLGILHIKLHWGRYYMRQTLSLPIASSIEGVARAAYDYPAMSRMILMTTTGDCAINASNYDVRLENFDLYCSGDLSGKIGVLTNSWDNSQRGIVFRNFKVSQFQTSIKLSNLVNWNILFDRVTFEYGDYGLWIEANKLVINLSDCYFNGIREEDVHTKQYSTALSFSHCNFGCRKKVFKNEWNNLDWRNFGEVSFYGCNFEVDVYDLANVSGCFVDIDDGCQVSLSFIGCDFNVDQANSASVTCFKFGNRTRATYIGCHGKESQYVHFDGDFFDTSYPPEATAGSLVIDSTCVGLKAPTYDSAHSMSCRDEHELFESYTHVNPKNIFDNVVVNYSYAGVRDAGDGVLEFFTASPPQSCASIVIDVPAGYRNIPLTLSAWTGTHNRWIAVATPVHPDEDRSQTPTLLADTYSTADGRDYCSINMNGNRYLLLYYYLMSADGNPEKFAMSEGLMLSEGSYHYPYVNHIVVDKTGYHIAEKFIPPVKITGRSGALPLANLNDLVPSETGTRIFGEVNTFGGTSGNLPTGFSGFGTLDATLCVKGTRCIQRLIGGNGNMYVRRALRNTDSDPWSWESWKTFTGT